MGWRSVLAALFVFLVIGLLAFYWLIPGETFEFNVNSNGNSNFSLNVYDVNGMQFYPNMRYPDSQISYRISDKCTLQKKDDMKRAFDIIEDLTVLDFYPLDSNSNEEITVECDERIRYDEDFFVAGEGGPTNITVTKNFNVILHGSVLLLRDSKCENPNIAIHELLHALGFDHSSNPNNIMYGITKCSQTIGEDIPETIDYLYSTPSYPDLSFENISATMRGRYLDLNMSVRNNGLKDTEEFDVIIYINGNNKREINFEPLRIGYGKAIVLTNFWVPDLNVKEIELYINSSFEELEKNNNRIKLEIKK